MHKRFFGLGLTLAVTIAGAAWAHQSTSKTATRLETVDVETWDAASSADASQLSGNESSRRLLGLCLLAMTGTTVVLRARRPRTI
jgi:hypothetical protein